MHSQPRLSTPSLLIAISSLIVLIFAVAATTAQPIALPVEAQNQNRAFSFEQKLVEPSPVVDNRYGLQLDFDGTTLAVSAVHIDSEDEDDPENYIGSVYIYTADSGGNWTLQQTLETPDTVKDDSFGGAVAIQGDWLVVGAPGTPSTGKAYIYKRTGTTWGLHATLTPDSSTAPPALGTSVALNGNRMLIGAPGEGIGNGAVYIYDWNGSAWTRTDKLSGPGMFAAFGFSVALDGNTALIGGTLIDGLPGAANDQGEAYVYFYNGSDWVSQGTLLPSDRANADRFGFAVDLSGDTALISAYNNGGATGGAYVFTRTGSTWTQQTKLLPAEAIAGDRVGWSVDLQGDLAVVGADGRDQSPYTDLGAVYLFKRTGTSWAQIQKVLPSDNATDTEFGGAVDIEGQELIVGAPDKQNDEGAVYTYSDVTLPTSVPPTFTATSAPGTTVPPTMTPTPLVTPVVVPAVRNGGFEEVDTADSKQALYWEVKNASGDKRKCDADKAHSGDCFYQIKGGNEEQTKLTQLLDLSSYTTATDHQMYASGFYFASGEVNAKLKITATMADSSSKKIKLAFKEETIGWQPFTGYETLSGAPVEIKWTISNKSVSGKIRFDDLSLCNCCCPSPLRLADQLDIKPLTLPEQ